jgi:DNA-binding NarL/FixJ family response regulator
MTVHRVLIVDDVAVLRQHAIEVLRSISPNVVVMEATTGQEGLDYFRSQRPDLIIMDIVMPQMNGIKAAQQIWSENPRQKILFWSQFHRESYVRELGKIVPDEAIHGYALKRENEQKLAYAITSVLLQDNPYIDPIVRGVQQSLNAVDSSMNETDYSILLDLIMGLTDKAIALHQHISVRGAQNRISLLSSKLLKGLDANLRETAGLDVYNTRVRIVLEAFRRGFIDPDDIGRLDKEIDAWVKRRFGFQREAPSELD